MNQNKVNNESIDCTHINIVDGINDNNISYVKKKIQNDNFLLNNAIKNNEKLNILLQKNIGQTNLNVHTLAYCWHKIMTIDDKNTLFYFMTSRDISGFTKKILSKL